MEPLIIFCEHAVETLTYFSGQLAQAFSEWGYDIFWLDFDMLALGAWKLKQAAKEREAVLITFNFIGLSWEEDLWEFDEEGCPDACIWEQLGIKCLNIMVDHPIYYSKALLKTVPGMQTFCIDRDHVAYMKRFYPNIPCEFLPSAGNLLEEEGRFGNLPEDADVRQPGKLPEDGALRSLEPYAKWKERPYPLVFTGNYVPLANIKTQLDHLEPEYRDFYYEIIDAFISHPDQDLLSLIEPYMRREIPDITDEGLRDAMNTMQAVDLWIRTYFREKVVRVLAESGLPVQLYGQDWDRVSWKHPPNLVVSGKAVNSIDCVRAMAQAKLALNVMPWFKDGAHDRIFTAMLQGAVALTDGSRFLHENFKERDTLVFYRLEELEKLPITVRELLEEPGQLYEIAVRAKAVAGKFHTWRQRAEVIRSSIRTISVKYQSDKK